MKHSWLFSILLLVTPAVYGANPPQDAVVEVKISFGIPGPLSLIPSQSVCTGFFVSRTGNVLTANHCVPEDSFEVTIITTSKETYTAQVVGRDEVHDLALLDTVACDTQPIKLAKKNPRLGNPVQTIGHPSGLLHIFRHGYVARIFGEETMWDIGVLPGSSGSPVMDKHGRLVGVITRLRTWNNAYTGLAKGPNLYAIKDFLDKWQL